jgi:hypothetical protein
MLVARALFEQAPRHSIGDARRRDSSRPGVHDRQF